MSNSAAPPFSRKRRAHGDLIRAKQYHEQALSLDPASAPAWAGLASVYWLQFAVDGEPAAVFLPKVKSAAQNALDLDPGSVEAHLRMASYFDVTGNAAAARRHRQQAANLQPNDSLLLAQLASAAADEGDWEEAIMLQRRASSAAPLSLVAAANVAFYYFLAGRVDEARRAFEKVVELDPTQPDEIGVFAQILEGDYQQALHSVDKWAESPVRDQSLALIYHGLGRSDEAREHLDKLIATVGEREPVRVAEVYAFRGETNAAFRWLQTGESRLCIPRAMYASPFLKSLRADARWSQVTKRKYEVGVSAVLSRQRNTG